MCILHNGCKRREREIEMKKGEKKGTALIAAAAPTSSVGDGYDRCSISSSGRVLRLQSNIQTKKKNIVEREWFFLSLSSQRVLFLTYFHVQKRMLIRRFIC
jgi:hypothetical protein